ncbi:MAG: hypothetical protein GXZ06_07145, partial [Tissierellia bacterium]|nr:hypothetical protein [Tissierellia bacterium]
EATQEEVDAAVAALVAAMEGLKLKPRVVARYYPYFLPMTGDLKIEIDDPDGVLEGAAKFSVTYHLSDEEDGTPVTNTSEIVAIDDAAIIFYYPAATGYDAVDINIYDEEENKIYEFVDVVPEVISQTAETRFSKITSVIIGDEVFDIEELNYNTEAQLKLMEYIYAGYEVYIKLDNNTIVNLEGRAIKL